MKRKNFVALLVVLMMVAVLALAGCSQPAQEASTEAAESSSAPASESAAEESPAGGRQCGYWDVYSAAGKSLLCIRYERCTGEM